MPQSERSFCYASAHYVLCNNDSRLLPQTGKFLLEVTSDAFGTFSHIQYFCHNVIVLPVPSPCLKVFKSEIRQLNVKNIFYQEVLYKKK